MDTGSTLILSLVVTVLISFLLHQVLKRKRADDAAELPGILANPNRSIHFKDITAVDKYGKELIYNDHVTYAQVKKLKKQLDETFGEQEALSELRNLILNKELQWNRREF